MELHQQLEASQNRRMANEDRYLRNLERKEAKASHLIGELIRNGKLVYYINLRTQVGLLTGKTKESTSKQSLYDYLIRNGYV